MNNAIFSKHAEKFLERLLIKDRTRIMCAVWKLPEGDVVALKKPKGDFRLQVSDWRVIYIYSDRGIFVKEIGNRGDNYK